MRMKMDIATIKDIAREAGREILAVYGTEFDVESKDDKSPLTEADRRANDLIVHSLTHQFPNIPIISEENRQIPYEERREWQTFWLVDPLDGTKEFIRRNGEFTVNIALVEDGVPILGVVFQPVGDRLYWASRGEGAWLSENDGHPIALEGGPHYSSLSSITVVASRSHLTDEVRKFVDDLRSGGREVNFLSAGSSLKICLVAQGLADVYPRLGPTMEWDTGAAHAIALESGRQVFSAESGEPLRYNKENLLNPGFFVE